MKLLNRSPYQRIFEHLRADHTREGYSDKEQICLLLESKLLNVTSASIISAKDGLGKHKSDCAKKRQASAEPSAAATSSPSVTDKALQQHFQRKSSAASADDNDLDVKMKSLQSAGKRRCRTLQPASAMQLGKSSSDATAMSPPKRHKQQDSESSHRSSAASPATPAEKSSKFCSSSAIDFACFNVGKCIFQLQFWRSKI